ncbi:hypothetical protein [Cognatishimia sp.]|uniref:hypothetical protein n=1 Tax=Cognatishimia sp. TaxID=2211648 RepID=UPI0035174FC3|nr:hypothetical protein [Cognatishimia sp.]
MEDLLNLEELISEADKLDAVQESRNNGELINVSALYKLCPRQYYYSFCNSDTIRLSQYAASRTLMTYTLGRAAETHVRKQLFKSIGINRIFASWVVDKDCKDKHITLEYNKETKQWEYLSTRFGTDQDSVETYREVTIIDDYSKATGHPDIIYLDNNGKLSVGELKTISKDKFAELFSKKPEFVAPVEGHREQISPYLYKLPEHPAVIDTGLSVNRYGKILYICKDHRTRNEKEKKYGYNPMYREFLVDLAHNEDAVYAMLEDSKTSIEHLHKKQIPPRTKCSSLKSKLAKDCPFAARCFSGDVHG